MNILILNSIGGSKWGGGEKWMLLAAKGLADRGHRVFIGCRKGSVIEQNATAQHIPVVSVSMRSDFSLLGAIDLYRLGKQHRFDVVIGCQNRDVRNTGLFRQFLGSPLVLSRQGVKLIKNSWKHRWTFTRYCDGIITNTQSIKDEYDSYGWWDQSFVKVIFNGVEEPFESESFDYSKYIPERVHRPKIILSAGRLSAQKGFQYLVDAAAEVCRVRNDVYFFIAGKGKLLSKLEHSIQQSGLQGRVIMLGFHDNLGPLLNGADLFVLSSLYEGMPNVVMEAMIQKVPVVSTSVNGVNELFANRDAGCIVPPANAEALSDAILENLAQPNPEQVERAYHRITQQFSVQKMVEELENHLVALLSQKA